MILCLKDVFDPYRCCEDRPTTGPVHDDLCVRERERERERDTSLSKEDAVPYIKTELNSLPSTQTNPIVLIYGRPM